MSITIDFVDTGVGISETGLQNLFVNFGKLAENSSMNKGGTGLGLSICKNIIEQMGGNVNVKSKLGKGTTFSVAVKTKCIPVQTEILELNKSVVDFVRPSESSSLDRKSVV